MSKNTRNKANQNAKTEPPLSKTLEKFAQRAKEKLTITINKIVKVLGRTKSSINKLFYRFIKIVFKFTLYFH